MSWVGRVIAQRGKCSGVICPRGEMCRGKMSYILLCNTCVDASQRRPLVEVKLEIFRQEGRVARQREAETETNGERQVERVRQ